MSYQPYSGQGYSAEERCSREQRWCGQEDCSGEEGARKNRGVLERRVLVAISYHCGTRNSLSQGLNVISTIFWTGVFGRREVFARA